MPVTLTPDCIDRYHLHTLDQPNVRVMIQTVGLNAVYFDILSATLYPHPHLGHDLLLRWHGNVCFAFIQKLPCLVVVAGVLRITRDTWHFRMRRRFATEVMMAWHGMQ